MSSEREAKRILKAFGKEEGKARIRYVESFLPEKTSFIGSISYKHALRRAGLIVLITALILALAVSAYAAVMHYLNYIKIVHSDNDEYVSIIDGHNQTGAFDEIDFYEPTYIPDGYKLDTEEYDEDFQIKEWHYIGENGDILSIKQEPVGWNFHMDNENTTNSVIAINDVEVIVYESVKEIVGIFQIDETLTIVKGKISVEELKEIINGIIPEY